MENIALTLVYNKQRSYLISCLIKTFRILRLLPSPLFYYLTDSITIEIAKNDITAKSKINEKIKIGTSFNKNCLKYDSIIFLC